MNIEELKFNIIKEVEYFALLMDEIVDEPIVKRPVEDHAILAFVGGARCDGYLSEHFDALYERISGLGPVVCEPSVWGFFSVYLTNGEK